MMVPVLQRNNEKARREFLEISAASAFGYLSLSRHAESWGLFGGRTVKNQHAVI
jgi:hypothetical protein